MATYDPNKAYTWGPDTKFVLSGQDFSLILHTLRGILSTKEATNVILAYEANKKIEGIMATAVAEGKVVESAEANVDDIEVHNPEVLPSKAKGKLSKA
jgi:hypothetical protein